MAKGKPFKQSKRKPNTHGMNYLRRCRLVLDFARDHNLVINPGKGYDYYIEGFLQFGRCPCDPKRLECPCSNAIEDVQQKGHCLCNLFWKDLDTYKNSCVPEI